jgi:RNA polymerase sigma-70 factor (ECF subfamily)
MTTPVDPEFERQRERLHGIAYRMTSSVADADDVVQEVWVRWHAADRAQIEQPEAWLVRVATNLAIDRSRARARRREVYVGPDLPEPLVHGASSSVAGRAPAVDPAEQAALGDSLTFAFLVLLDELEPVARAVMLLHDVFAYSFDEIATMVDRTPAACRQIASRARRHLAARAPGRDVRRADRAHDARMLDELVVSMAAGEADRVISLLSPGVVVTSDGGAHRHAARRPVVGADRAARLLVNLAARVTPTMTFEPIEANGGPALLVRDGGAPFLLLTIACGDDGRIERVFSQLNPDKLRHLGPTSPGGDRGESLHY